VVGDRYGGEFPREQFRKHGVSYEPSPKFKNDLYRDLLPLLNSRKIELLDHPRLVNQLVGLERRTARGGKDSIDHAQGAHDDLANAAAGALVSCTSPGGRIIWGTVAGCGALGPGQKLVPGELDPQFRPEPRSSVRFVYYDEHGNELTPDEACLVRHGLHPRQLKKERRQ
jgi:hypothetical protein